MSAGGLDGTRIVVSGSTRGLGLAFARALTEAGAAVVINGRDPDRCEQVVAELAAGGARVLGVAGGVEHEATADALVATAVEAFGGVDMVINNAGITRDRTLTRMTADEFDEVIAVHLRGAWALSRAGARAMVAGGHGGAILNIVSGSALYGLVGQSNYAAAKGGMLAMTRALSVELARKGIRVNALYPVGATDMTRPVTELMGHDAMPFGDTAEVAPVVRFLASDAAAHLTGQLIHFDGRDLVVWSHPQPRAREHREQPWSDADIAAFFTAGADPSEPLHPDRWGGGMRSGPPA